MKNKTEIHLNNRGINIQSKFIKKEISYGDIKILLFRKNFLGSYDIVINIDDSINLYRYFCNYFFDASIRKNHKKSYIICDVKNFKEIRRLLLKKINTKTSLLKKQESLYIRYSLIENQMMILGYIFLLVFILSVAIKDMRIFLLIYFIFISIKFFKKVYTIEEFDGKIIRIYNDKKEMYVFESYKNMENKIIIDYGLKIKYNYYYLTNNLLPSRYKIIRQEVHKKYRRVYK